MSDPSKELRDALDSLDTVAACWCGDWSTDHRLAWMYGIICGWGDALPEVAEKHRWDAAKTERLRCLHRAFARAASRDLAKRG